MCCFFYNFLPSPENYKVSFQFKVNVNIYLSLQSDSLFIP